AAGAPIGQIIIATGSATVLTLALLWLCIGHQNGSNKILGRLAAFAERTSGLPGWAALPLGLGGGSLFVALLGMYWDISLHIDNGRDPGPLANPAHYLILAGLYGIFTAGLFSIVLPRDESPGPAAVSIARGKAPVGGVLMFVCGAFALLGFPLDDMWHRLFGQDVTLWGPTHLMLIGGAAMTLVGIAVLAVEGMRAKAAGAASASEFVHIKLARAIALTGGLLLGLSTFQAEFDFGVPQFQLIFQPILLMLAAGIGLVLARIYAGRGAALGAAVFFIVLRGGLAILIGPIIGQTTPHFPLYIAEALVVEAVAFMVPTRRPVAFGLAAGVGIGTIGLAAEWAWSQLWMPLPWPAAAFPEAALLGFAAATAGSMLGAWIGTHLSPEPLERSPLLRRAAVCSAAVVAALVGYGLFTQSQQGVSAQVALKDVSGAPNREVEAVVRMSPPDAAANSEWFDVTAWQGGGLVVDPLKRIGDGVYRTTEPIPVYGNWKAMIRLHKGNSLTAVPIYLPRDTAIPVGEIPAPDHFTRGFGNEHKLLQREQKGGSPLLVAVAYSAVAAIALSLLVLLAWGLHRLALDGARAPRRRRLRIRALGFQQGGR
ncbi:MAG TPA: hypothetical protein VFL77_10170, partial [Solirubrobacterales bacterium]|nr:hypothetical protein [Solirubrobacterales bacterium]